MKSIYFLFIIFLSMPVYAQTNANPSDLSQAQSFVSKLPKDCGSDIRTSSDGTVIISFSCPGKDGKVMLGNIHVKDGKITDMK